MTYNLLAKYYDAFQDKVQVEANLQSVVRLCKQHLALDSAQENLLLADLGCGTGALAVKLVQHPFQITGLDLSTAMLEEFEQKCLNLSGEEREKIKLVHADMCTYRFEKPQDILLSMTDGLNHIPAEKLSEVFETAAENLRRGGLFVFDLLQHRFLSKDRGSKTYFAELGKPPKPPKLSMIWENKWYKTSASAVSKLTFFERIEQTDTYQRNVERILEYYHDFDTIAYLWAAFECLDHLDNAERRLFILRKK